MAAGHGEVGTFPARLACSFFVGGDIRARRGLIQDDQASTVVSSALLSQAELNALQRGCVLNWVFLVVRTEAVELDLGDAHQPVKDNGVA